MRALLLHCTAHKRHLHSKARAQITTHFLAERINCGNSGKRRSRIMCISTSSSTTSPTGGTNGGASNGSTHSSSSTDLLHSLLLNGGDDCKEMQPILPDDGGYHSPGHSAHSTTATMRKRPRLADCAEHWAAKRRLIKIGSSDSSESTMPEPDSTLMMSSDEEEEEAEESDEGFQLQVKAAAARQARVNFSSKPLQTNQQSQMRSKMPFSLLLHMSQFEPWQITVKVQPDRRTLEVRGRHEIRRCSPPPASTSDEEETEEDDKQRQTDDGKSVQPLTDCDTSVDFERLEYVKHLKVPPNVALEALSCTLDQNGWLRVEAPTREQAIVGSTTPDQSAQWTEARLIPVKVIDRS